VKIEADIDTDFSGIRIKEEADKQEDFEYLKKVEVPSGDFLKEWLKLKPTRRNERKRTKSGVKSKTRTKTSHDEAKGGRCKAFRCISMLDVFGDEINDEKYFELPQVLENFDDNPKLWSDFSWTCKECDESFVNILELDAHFRKVHEKRYLTTTCLECQKETCSYAMFLNHTIEDHHKNLKFCCIVCSEYHGNFMDLHKHHESSHSSSKIKFCLYCGLHFNSGSTLRVHMVQRHNRPKFGEQYECDICGRQLNFRIQIYKHMLTHKIPEVPCHLW
jgi:hypothetical protein